MRIKRLILLVAIIVVVILLYKMPPKSLVEEGPEKTIEDQPPVKDDNLTAFGDLISINYVLKIKDNGKVIDTNDPVLAEKSNISDYIKGPFKLIIGNSGKLKAKSFDKALVGWKVGEKKSVEIPPSEEEMYIMFNRTKSENLYFAIPRYQRLPLKSFREFFNKEAVIGDVVSNPGFPWSFKIVNMTENSAVGDPVIKVNEKYKLPKEPWPVEVVSVYERVIQLKHAPEKDIYDTTFGLTNVSASESKLFQHYNPVKGDTLTYDISLGPVSIPAAFEVSDVSESEFTIHRTDNINDRWLVLEAEILERIPDVKEVSEESLLEKVSTQKISR